jgi:hypothetical protein
MPETDRTGRRVGRRTGRARTGGPAGPSGRLDAHRLGVRAPSPPAGRGPSWPSASASGRFPAPRPQCVGGSCRARRSGPCPSRPSPTPPGRATSSPRRPPSGSTGYGSGLRARAVTAGPDPAADIRAIHPRAPLLVVDRRRGGPLLPGPGQPRPGDEAARTPSAHWPPACAGPDARRGSPPSPRRTSRSTRTTTDHGHRLQE